MLDAVGFESGDLLECYASANVSLISDSGAARHGAYCGRLYAAVGDEAYVQLGAGIVPSATQQTRIAFGVRLRALPLNGCTIAALVQDGLPVLYVALQPSGELALYGSGSSPADTSSSTDALNVGQYYYVEFDVPTVSGGSYGICKVYVDGAEVLSAIIAPALSASGTYHALVGTVLTPGLLVDVGGLDCYLDDLVFARLTGTAPVAAWGSAQVFPFLAITDNGNVDDWPGTSDGDSTYSALGATVGGGWSHETAIGQTPSGESILGALAKVRGRADTSPGSGEGLQVGIEAGAPEFYSRLWEWSGTSYLTGAYGSHINPTTGLAWSESGLDDFSVMAYRDNGGAPATAARVTAAGLYLVCTADLGAGGTGDPSGGGGADPTDPTSLFFFFDFPIEGEPGEAGLTPELPGDGGGPPPPP